jgi:hypothetical protein
MCSVMLLKQIKLNVSLRNGTVSTHRFHLEQLSENFLAQCATSVLEHADIPTCGIHTGKTFK